MEEQTLKEKVKKEWEKLRPMSFSKKLEYIWDYYKPLLAGAGAVILLVVVLVQMIHARQIVTELSVAFINGYDSEGAVEKLHDGYVEYAGLGGEKQEVILDTGYQIKQDSIDEMTMGSQAKVMASIAAGSLDILILPQELFETYRQQGAFLDLATLLTAEEYAQWEEKFVLGETDTDTEQKAYGIDVTNSEKIAGIFQESPIILAVTTKAENTKNAQKFVQYLLS